MYKTISQPDLVKKTGLSKQEISRITKILIDKGFLNYKTESNKKRKLKLFFTDTGKLFLKKLFIDNLYFDKSALRRIYCGNNKIPEFIQNLQGYADNLATVYNKKNKKAHA